MPAAATKQRDTTAANVYTFFARQKAHKQPRTQPAAQPATAPTVVSQQEQAAALQHHPNNDGGVVTVLRALVLDPDESNDDEDAAPRAPTQAAAVVETISPATPLAGPPPAEVTIIQDSPIFAEPIVALNPAPPNQLAPLPPPPKMYPF